MSRLRSEYGDRSAPEESASWSEALLRRWYADGGELRVASLAAEAPTAATRSLIDRVGADLPVSELEVLGGSLYAATSGDTAVLADVAERLERDDHVACTLGLGDLSGVAAEGDDAWPQMRPGELRASDGGLVRGVSPSGAKRGDRYALFRDLSGDWPGLARVDDALGAVATALAPLLPSCHIGRRSDTFVAKFSGDGLGYGAHFDGDDLCRVTMIAYTSRDWTEAHGGRLLLLDENRRTWWSVPPRADTLVLFRSDRVLHKVLPCYEPRIALTTFLSKAPPTRADVERAALLSSLAFSV